jgi:hypothetical protein
MDQEIQNILKSGYRGTSKSGRIKIQYQLSSINFENGKVFTVCNNAFSLVFELSRKKRLKMFNLLKRGIQSESTSSRVFNDKTKVSNEVIQQVQETLHRSEIDMDWDSLSNIGVSNTVAAMKCKSWMKHFFDLVGDKMPNTKTKEIHLDCMQRCDVHDEYICNMKNWFGDKPGEYLSSASFNKMWQFCFPHVKIREYKAVCGKCLTCEKLSTLRRNSKDLNARSKLTQLHAFHREMYMNERETYYDRAFLAAFNPGRFMSLMLDGMDKNKTKIPRLSQNVQQEWQMQQHIIGVLDHGRGSFFYRTYPNLKDDRTIPIHILLLHLANRLEESSPNDKSKQFLPEVIFIQADGGGDFSNETTLAVLSYLVAKRIGGCKRIVYTRLPVGHTHDVRSKIKF